MSTPAISTMSKSLRIIITIQIVLGAIWTLPLLTLIQNSWAPIYLFVYIYPFHFVFFLVALWALWKHPDSRRNAVWVMLLPIGFLFLPYLITWLIGAPLHKSQLLRFAAGSAVASVIAGIVFPKKAVKVLPKFLFRSRGFNIMVLTGLALTWLTPVALLIWLAQQSSVGQSGGGQGSPGMAAAYFFVGMAMYFVGIGAASLGTALLGWLGLRGGVDGARRRLHIAEIVSAVPGLLLGATTLAWLASQAN